MKLIKKICQYCGKKMTSLYQKQIDYNMSAHELSCKENPKNKDDAFSQSSEVKGE